MLTMTSMFDENGKAKFKEAAAAFRSVMGKPGDVINRAVLVKPKAAVLALARTRPIVYNEWD
jgi:hypothetical protein